MRAVGGLDVEWRMEHELLALGVELSSANLRAFIAANSDEGAELPPILRIPRPRDGEWRIPDELEVDEPAQQSTPAEVSAFARASGGRVIVVPHGPPPNGQDE
jgi:hypothetical protein